MMGRRNKNQDQPFYSIDLNTVVPNDHLVSEVAAVRDLTWLRKELAPYCSQTDRPSIDPVFMIRMLTVGYVFAIRIMNAHYDARCRSTWPTGGSSGCVLMTNRQIIRRVHVLATNGSVTAILTSPHRNEGHRPLDRRVDSRRRGWRRCRRRQQEQHCVARSPVRRRLQ